MLEIKTINWPSQNSLSFWFRSSILADSHSLNFNSFNLRYDCSMLRPHWKPKALSCERHARDYNKALHEPSINNIRFCFALFFFPFWRGGGGGAIFQMLPIYYKTITTLQLLDPPSEFKFPKDDNLLYLHTEIISK